MKTVMKRALSLVMCLLVVFSAMSVSAFAVSATDETSYKTYAQNSTKENVHHLLDFLDEALADLNINEEIDLGITSVKIDLTSIDAVCSTLDKFRLVITLAKGLLGDLKDLNLKVFDDEGMSRAKSGDVKIFSEILELAAANSDIIAKLIAGDLNLGKIAEKLGLDLSGIDISKEIRLAVLDVFFDNSDSNYAAAKNRALTDFDAFVYTDLVGILSKDGGLLEGIEIDATTTVDHLITDVFNILVNEYLIDIVKGESFSFATLGSEYEKLDELIQIDGVYDFSGIVFTKEKTVLEQINNVIGAVFAQIVPSYVWESGDYTNLGDNVIGLVKHIAEESGLIEDVEEKTDDALMLEIFKLVFFAADTNGEKEIYNVIKDTTTIPQMVNEIVVHLSGTDYPAGTSYEVVVGDYLIDLLEASTPLYDSKGKEMTVGGDYTLWEVLNSALNFYFVDKDLDSFFGWSFTKSSSWFDKVDIMLDMTANDGTASFDSEKYIKGLIECIFKMDLQGFVNETAVRALNFAGDISVANFLYNTVYNLINNWSASSASLTKHTAKPFENTIANSGLANILKVVIETLKARNVASASFAGLVFGAIADVSEKVELMDATCTSIGYKTMNKTCLKCNKVYLKGEVISAKGHKYDSGVVIEAPTCNGDGKRKRTCTVCGVQKTETIAKTGHKESGYKITKAATYKAKGWSVNKCTICNAVLGEKVVNMLTLAKPTGLKATAVSTKSIKFSWNAVQGAESYVLYYRAGSGKWTQLKTTSTNATVKKLKVGTTYKFKVVAVAGSNKSKESATVSATTKPAKVTLKALRSSKKSQVIVQWKKVSGVTGYEVQLSTAKKFTKKSTKTVTIKKQKTEKTIVKKLKSKKKYFVKVRAYKTVNKEKVYGAFSKVKTIKCK